MSQVSKKYLCLNSSTWEQLRGVIPEIGKKMAKRIVKVRKQRPFQSWDDLKRVSRIGDGIVKKLRARYYLFLNYPPTQALEEMEEMARTYGDRIDEETYEAEWKIGDLVCLADTHDEWGGNLPLKGRIVGIREEWPGFYDLEFEEGVTGVYHDFDFYPWESDFKEETPYFMKNITEGIGSVYLTKVINVKSVKDDPKQIRKDLEFEGTDVFNEFPFVGRIRSEAMIEEHPRLKEMKASYKGGEVRFSSFARSIKTKPVAATATIVGKNHDHILAAAHQLSLRGSAKKVAISNLTKKLKSIGGKFFLLGKREAQRDILERGIKALNEWESEIPMKHVFFPQFHCDQPDPKFQDVCATPVLIGEYELEGTPFTYEELLEGPTKDAKFRRGHDYVLLKLAEPVKLDACPFPLATISGSEKEVEQALTDLACFGYPSNKFEYKTTTSKAPMIYDEQHCLGTRTAFSSQSDYIRSNKSKTLDLKFNDQESYIQVRGLDASEGSSGSQLFMKHKGRYYGIGILGGPCFSKPLASNPEFAYEDTAFCPYTTQLFAQFKNAGLEVVTEQFNAKDLILAKHENATESVGLKRSLEELKSFNPDKKKRKRSESE